MLEQERLQVPAGDAAQLPRKAARHDIAKRKKIEVEREPLIEQLRELNGRLVVTNLQAQEHAEKAERRAAELDAIITASTDGLMLFGPKGEIVRMNPAAQRVLGYSEEDCKKPIAERLAELRLETLEGKPFPLQQLPVMRALHGETVHSVESVRHLRDGRTVWVSSSATPICAPDGHILGAVSTSIDITELHQLEEQRQDLLRSISHDLRNPLTVIHGQAQLLQARLEKAGPTDLARSSIDAIITSARRMNAMLRDLADSIRLESGQMAIQSEPVDLDLSLAELLRRCAGTVSVERVRTEMPADLPPVSADPDLLERIMVNLLTNALKYSPPGTEVLIKVERAGSEAVIQVTDRGDGISPDDLPRVFDRFFRARRTRNVEGLGLGLFIVKVLVQAQGGQIRAQSEPGKGSNFCFTLPLA